MVGPRPQSPQGQPATKIETPLHSILIGNVNAIQQGSTATSATRYYERRSHEVTSVKGCDIFSVYQIGLKLYTQCVVVAVRYPRLKGSENSPSGHGDPFKIYLYRLPFIVIFLYVILLLCDASPTTNVSVAGCVSYAVTFYQIFKFYYTYHTHLVVSITCLCS